MTVEPLTPWIIYVSYTHQLFPFDLLEKPSPHVPECFYSGLLVTAGKEMNATPLWDMNTLSQPQRTPLPPLH
jgi:hypothetical protein